MRRTKGAVWAAVLARDSGGEACYDAKRIPPGPAMQRTYFDHFDPSALRLEYPLGDAFLAKFCTLSRDAIWQEQNERFKRLLARAWRMRFYQRLWGNAGVQPGDIRSLLDIEKLPVFGKAELAASIALAPPFGDYLGLDSYPAGEAPPFVMHTTSGTTGAPQPLFFGPKGREIQNLLLARAYLLQGMQPGDVVHSVYGHGLINGGHFVREAVLHWTNAVFISAGTGIETRSARQVEIMRDFKATVIVGFADYIKKLAEVARENGIEPGRDIPVRLICGHLGREDRAQMRALWGGAQLFDWYGVGDTGTIASEGPDQDGLYLMEDAQFVEILDVDTGAPVPAGTLGAASAPGDLVVTTLYKDDLYPLIRFNTHDVTAIHSGESSLGLNLRRMTGFLGRSDNMVKLRGINIFPQALGPLLQDISGFTGEFICVVRHTGAHREEMLVQFEAAGNENDSAELAQQVQLLLRAKLGVDVAAERKTPGALAVLTGIESRQKPIRLIDQRGQ
jgi:phenylacetate-CoA ligase